MEKEMLYKVCKDEQGKYQNAEGERISLLACNEVFFPPVETMDEDGNTVSMTPAPEEKGYRRFASLEEALSALGLTQLADAETVAKISSETQTEESV